MSVLQSRVSPSSDPFFGLQDTVRQPGNNPLDVRAPDSRRVARRKADGRFVSAPPVAASSRHPAHARVTIPVGRTVLRADDEELRLRAGDIAIGMRCDMKFACSVAGDRSQNGRECRGGQLCSRAIVCCCDAVRATKTRPVGQKLPE